MRKLLLGVIIGCVMMASTSVLAEGGLEGITAYLRGDMPIKLDGEQLELDNDLLVYKGTTYLPLREMAVAFGKKVQWDGQSQTIEITSPISLPEEGSVPAMGSQSTTSADVKMTTFQSLRAVETSGQMYFSPTDYNRKNPDSNAFVVDVSSRELVVNKTDGTSLTLNLDDENVIIIYNGESYINVEYYPGE